MSTDNTPVDPVEDDVNLDDFTAELFGQTKAEPEPASSEDTDDDPKESDASNEEDTHSNVPEDGTDVDGDDTPAPNDEDDDDGEEEEASDEANPKPKKNRFQERIDKEVGKSRHLERELNAALAEIERLKQDSPEPKPQVKDDTAPTPSDMNEDGTEKYPLGEFDPNYIKDLMKHTLKVEQEAAEAQRREEELKRMTEAAQSELQANWQEKLGPAQERYPDFREKGEQLLGTFDGIDEAYGEYLTSTLMSMDFGPDVLYYLANNVDEAQKIVNSGPQRATVALGRLEAKFAEAAEEKQRARPKVSSAPTPPPQVNKGSSVVKPSIRGDEDDLDAVSAALFPKKRK